MVCTVHQAPAINAYTCIATERLQSLYTFEKSYYINKDSNPQMNHVYHENVGGVYGCTRTCSNSALLTSIELLGLAICRARNVKSVPTW